MSPRGWLKLSIVVALATMALKAAAWWVSGSVGLLSDALESVVNVAGAAFALAMVTIAARPPDDDHPFGHHKAEYFASGFEGALILVAAAGIAWAAVERLLNPQPLEAAGLGIALSAVSAAMNGALAAAMRREARRSRSVALDGDARHLFTDVWTSAGVIVGVLAVQATGWPWLDPLVALAVAANIVREGVSLLWRSTGGLMDEALDADTRERIDAVLQGFARQALRVDHVASRSAGRRRFVDLHLHLPASWTLERAAALRGDVERALIDAVPGLHPTIQLLPLNVEAASLAADDDQP